MSNNTDTSNGWPEYSKLVLSKLEDHEDILKEINKELTNLRIELAMLKVKSGAWGLIGGMIPVAIAIIIALFKGLI